MTADGAKVYPMTYEQEAIWLDDHLEDGPSRYLESWALRLTGSLDVDAAEWALARLIDRHESLRSRLALDGDELVQIVAPAHGSRVLLRSCTAADLDGELREIVSQPLGLVPLRATVLQLAPGEFVLIVGVHHAVVDDWSLAILDREFAELYAARVEDRPPRLEPPPQLGEYAMLQRSAGTDAAHVGYWREHLRRVPVRNGPPPDRTRPADSSHLAGQIRFAVSEETGRLVRAVSRQQRSTPFTVFAAALTALLCGYNHTGEMILGTPVSHRGAASLDGLVGCLTGLLPLRLPVRPEDSFAGLVAATREVVWEAVGHKDLPYSELVSKAVSRRDLGRLPLCQTVLVVDDVRQAPLTLPGLTAEPVYVPPTTAKFDLCVTIVVVRGRYRGSIDYACDLYDPGTAERIAHDFTRLLREVAGDPAAPLGGALRRIEGAGGSD